MAVDVRVGRPTAISYLENLVTTGFYEKYKIGKSNFYLNRDLFNLFVNAYRKQAFSSPKEDYL